MSYFVSEFSKKASLSNPNNDGPQHLVFVYGSLLKGLPNHCVLSHKEAFFHGKGVTQNGHTMLDLHGFPGLVLYGATGDTSHKKLNTTTIKGELYQVGDDGLKALDCLEGYPRFYDRHPIEIYSELHNAVVHAWCYNLGPDYATRYKVINGDWREYTSDRYNGRS